ncbi:roadblock/LC7 domain-containing protein [Actinomycetospora sp. TBRC 11914]|uniref:roadblock/LC7 domain-containing protein n=1 Tax=Actinomycetospora sp. TBRC 11914 TaxID=2729387 RepID=UPI00145F492F|nr:roadblock/LC7 domain-containing protein [Actinomycetospora sp. TBRC 11914]NMO89542.1 roadblock/LC7 domain-containing protein [Actinomycetospora sp. TBRC 11914]
MTAPTGALDWLVSDFAASTPGVRHVLVVSADGLRLAVSQGVGPELADQLCAATSGLVSLARGTAALLEAEPVSQTIVEMAGCFLFATAISLGSTLAVVTDRSADLGLVGYETTMLAARVGHALTPDARARVEG